ncbi:Importin alpha subunit (Karyopherin alpha subunit) (Serine-rich RNA polymerase I suppressor protein) [Gonapodya sp. JEL0774]|nr:Importin alpha subunit (Karyopherin alpha subunit) (Serine-rich RNA polymerase I suppressor protein) [Gonapodya sp. JEL0774]
MIAGVTGGRRTTASTDADLESLVGALHSSIANVRLTTSQTPVHPLDPVDSYEMVANLLPAHKESLLANLYSNNRSEHLRAVNVLRKYCSLSGKIEEHVKNIMPLNILPRIVELFKVPDGILQVRRGFSQVPLSPLTPSHLPLTPSDLPSPSRRTVCDVQYETSWILTNICANVPEAGADVVAAGAVPVLMDQLRSPSWRIAWQAIWTLGNILCTQDTHHAVVTGFSDLIPRLLQVVDFSHYDIPDGEMKEAKTCLNEQCVRALANVAMFPGLDPRNLYDALPFLAENVSPGTEQKALSHAIRGLKLIIGLIGGPLDVRAFGSRLLENLTSTLRHSISGGPSYNALGALDILSQVASGGPEHIQAIIQAAPMEDAGWAFVLRPMAPPRDYRVHSSDSVKAAIVPFVVKMTSGTKEQTIEFLKSGNVDSTPWQIWPFLTTLAVRELDEGAGKRDAVAALINLVALEDQHLDGELLRLDVMKILLDYLKSSVPPHISDLSGIQPTTPDPALFSRSAIALFSLLTAGNSDPTPPETALSYGGPNRFADALFVAGGFDVLWSAWGRSQGMGSLGEFDRGMAVIHDILGGFYAPMFAEKMTQFRQLEEMTRRVGGMGIQ